MNVPRFALIAPLLFVTHFTLAAGHLLVPPTVPESSYNIVVTATPSGYLIGWLQVGVQAHVMAARLGRDGTSLDDSGIVLAPTTNVPALPLPRLAVATTGSKSLLTWIDSGQDAAVRAVIFNDDDMPFLTPQPFVVSRNANRFPYKIPDPVISTAWNGHEFLVVWTNNNTIFETFVGADGTVHGERTLYKDPTEGISAVHLIFDGQRLVLVASVRSCWTCFPEIHVVAARLSADGTLLDAPLTIAKDSGLLGAASAHAGEALAVVSGKQGDSGILLSTSGPLSSGAPFSILDWKGFTDGAVTVDGDRYLVALAYQRASFHATIPNWLALTRIGRDGTVEPHTITTTPPLISPGIAVIPSGPVLITGSQTGLGEIKRPFGYFPAELGFMTPPAPPRNVRFTKSGFGAFMTWDDTSDDESGFAVIVCWTNTGGCGTYDFPANTTSAAVPAGDTTSVTSFNGAGESEAVPAMSAGIARRRVTK